MNRQCSKLSERLNDDEGGYDCGSEREQPSQREKHIHKNSLVVGSKQAVLGSEPKKVEGKLRGKK